VHVWSKCCCALINCVTANCNYSDRMCPYINLCCLICNDLAWPIHANFLAGQPFSWFKKVGLLPLVLQACLRALPLIKLNVYAGKHQRALRKGSQLVLTLARAPPKMEKHWLGSAVSLGMAIVCTDILVELLSSVCITWTPDSWSDAKGYHSYHSCYLSVSLGFIFSLFYIYIHIHIYIYWFSPQFG